MRVAGCLLVIMALVSCSLFTQRTSLVITIPASAAPTPASVSGGVSPRVIHVQTARFRITVSGAGLTAPIVASVGVSGSAVTAAIELPGPGRYDVTVEGLDSSSVVLTRGVVTVDAVAGSNAVRIAMSPLTPLKLYVANRGSNTISVINGADGSTVATIPVAAGPSAVNVNPSTRKVYVAHFGQDMTVINGSTDTVSSTITYGSSADFPSVGVDPVTNKIYASWQYDATPSVQVISGSSDSITTTVSYAAPPYYYTYPTDIAVNTATNKIYVLDWGNSEVFVVDGATDATIGQISVSSYEKCGIAANSVTNKIYAVDDSSSVYVFDGATDTQVGTITIGNAGIGRGVAVNTLTNRVYATNSADNTVSVINGQNDAVIATIAVGTAPRSVAVSRNYNRVYVVNNIDGATNGTVSIIDGVTNNVINTVSVGVDPQLIAVLE